MPVAEGYKFRSIPTPHNCILQSLRLHQVYKVHISWGIGQRIHVYPRSWRNTCQILCKWVSEVSWGYIPATFLCSMPLARCWIQLQRGSCKTSGLHMNIFFCPCSLSSKNPKCILSDSNSAWTKPSIKWKCMLWICWKMPQHRCWQIR